MLQTVNRQLERSMPFITPVSVILGVLFADHLLIFSFLIPWIFAFITFSGSLNSNFASLKGVIKSPLPLLIILLLLHIVMPVIAWFAGHFLFANDHFTVTGLVLASVIPTGITSFIWVTIYKGNIALALSIILFDTILSPFLVPHTLSFLVGQKVEIDTFSIMNGLIYMVVLPSIIGMFINQLSKGKSVNVGKTLAPFSKLGLASVVMINGAVVAPYLKVITSKLVVIAITVFILAFIGYLLAWLVGNWLNRDRETKVALIFTGGMRNISAGAVIAVQYFPPAVAVPVIVGMLFQQILASIFGFLFKKIEDRQVHTRKQLADNVSAS
ncbi:MULTISPECIES: bile acid:sodium symporter family protein [Metabacillus]|jgi:bile acid:Na+ symporter, BASS family|uniref:Bile acid:sodium symporter family protein n=2 Tax=Metabacillus TaxID=2675233 RepID=A0ABX6S5T6_9BACI|nr:bile acid:sodium symporter family protein [Metabacillus sp. KUDC1714]QNF29152.1 bile acid:sodium symporter family protein [Metabacillus sp. KUDC1714]